MTRSPATIVILICTTAVSACTAGVEHPAARPEVSTSAVTASASPTPTTPSRAAAIREWKKIAAVHFTESAAALQQVSDASADEDEAGLRAGCVRLHDNNSIGLQEDLPTPDVHLTAELQHMIDDMNVATHACLRFALARNSVDADTYQEYLGRAVEHLQRAKVILNAAEK